MGTNFTHFCKNIIPHQLAKDKHPRDIERTLWSTIITRGVFHLPRDSGKFRELRWEMLIGERRVPFDTFVPFIPGSLHRPMYFPPKYKMAAQLLLLNEMLDFSLEEECLVISDDDNIPFWWLLQPIWGAIFPEIKAFMKIFCLHISFTIDEFNSHLRMTRGTFEALCREVQAIRSVPKFLNQEAGND